jgi:hypothetical protein
MNIDTKELDTTLGRAQVSPELVYIAQGVLHGMSKRLKSNDPLIPYFNNAKTALDELYSQLSQVANTSI